VRRAAIPIVLLLGWVLAVRAAADLRLDAESQVGDAVDLRLRATNGADAPVHDVVPELVYRHRTVVAERVQTIGAHAAHEWQTSLDAPPGPGTFPVTIRLRYADPEAGTRSALLVHLIRTPGSPPADVQVVVATEPVARLAHGAVTLENGAPAPIAGRLVVALPADLRSDPESRPAEVPAAGRATLPVVVENVAARPGDVRPMFALFEYDRDGAHHAVLGEAMLSVAAQRADARPLLVGAAALAVALAALALAWRSVRARQPRV